MTVMMIVTVIVIVAAIEMVVVEGKDEAVGLARGVALGVEEVGVEVVAEAEVEEVEEVVEVTLCGLEVSTIVNPALSLLSLRMVEEEEMVDGEGEEEVRVVVTGEVVVVTGEVVVVGGEVVVEGEVVVVGVEEQEEEEEGILYRWEIYGIMLGKVGVV